MVSISAMVGWRRKCDSYQVFEKNTERSRAFLRIFDVDRTSGRPSNYEQELLRGAIVYSIGALDAFLHELVLELVSRFGLASPGMEEPLRAIAEDDASLALRVALVDGASKEAAFRQALDTWLERKSFQGAGRVKPEWPHLCSFRLALPSSGGTGLCVARRGDREAGRGGGCGRFSRRGASRAPGAACAVTVGLGAGLNDVGVEGDPVDDGGDEAGVGDDLAPFAERQVGGQPDEASLRVR